jgi:CheY-like chemotaxis protein
VPHDILARHTFLQWANPARLQRCGRGAGRFRVPEEPRWPDGFSYICAAVVSDHIVRGQCLSNRPRVLIAEDHPEMAKAVCRVLALDCEVVGSVADGSALLDAAQRLQPDVIVLDLHLPNVHGLEACRQIVQVNPETKVIVFTAMNDPDVRQRSFEAGASAFVSKTAGGGDLLSTVKRLCDGGG